MNHLENGGFKTFGLNRVFPRCVTALLLHCSLATGRRARSGVTITVTIIVTIIVTTVLGISTGRRCFRSISPTGHQPWL